MAETKEYPPSTEQPFVQHLIELRDRLLRVVMVVAVIFLCLFPFANDLYSFLAAPLIQKLPQGSKMIATGVISPFLTPFKLAMVASVFVSIPFILYQAWGFIAPGLYNREKRLVFPLLISSTFLFYLGMVFAYYVVFPLVFGFMATQTPEGVAQAPDITMYLDFSLKLFFAFGLAFEVPIATIILVWTGLTTTESLSAKRPYIIVGAFVVGMLLTPPDVISQTLLALPMWMLFELGLLFSRWYSRKPVTQDDEVDEQSGAGSTTVTKGNTKVSERIEPSFETAGYREEGQIESGESDDDPDANNSGHEEFEPLTEEEMDAELDRIEAEEEESKQTENGQDPNKL